VDDLLAFDLDGQNGTDLVASVSDQGIPFALSSHGLPGISQRRT
jgi:hypothetical protein